MDVHRKIIRSAGHPQVFAEAPLTRRTPPTWDPRLADLGIHWWPTGGALLDVQGISYTDLAILIIRANVMAWDIRKTYYYLVCFATLIMVIVGSVQIVQNILDLAIPEEPYRPTAIDMYQRFQRPAGEGVDDAPYTRAELEQMAEEEAETMRRQSRRRALRSLLGSIALVMIAAPVYMYHWKKVRADERLDE